MSSHVDSDAFTPTDAFAPVDLDAQATVTDADTETLEGDATTEARVIDRSPDTQTSSDDLPPTDHANRFNGGEEYDPQPRRSVGRRIALGAGGLAVAATAVLTFAFTRDSGESAEGSQSSPVPTAVGGETPEEPEVTPEDIEEAPSSVQMEQVIQSDSPESVDVSSIVTPDATSDQYLFPNYGRGLSEAQFEFLDEFEFPSTLPDAIDPGIGSAVSGIEHSQWDRDEISLEGGGFSLEAVEHDSIYLPANFRVVAVPVRYREANQFLDETEDISSHAAQLDTLVQTNVRSSVESDNTPSTVDVFRTVDQRGNVGWFVVRTEVDPEDADNTYSYGMYLVATERMVYAISGFNADEEGVPEVETFSRIALEVSDEVDSIYEEYEQARGIE